MSPDHPIVTTSLGKLQGAREAGVHLFRGIPFARPPVGGQRFGAPERPEPWTGVREATRFGAAASQTTKFLGPILRLGIRETSEDCLTLNVWTPGLDGAGRPVMVWIHGGAFLLGAGSQTLYDGAALARRGNVVVVTVNYRLGVLGFLRLVNVCGAALPSTGNEGLLDQIAALEWVQAEIRGFGGDPDNVTISGESAGAVSCAALLGAPRARGLFRRAILQSGSANYVSSAAEAKAMAERFLDEIDLAPGDAASLRAAPIRRLLAAQNRMVLGLFLPPQPPRPTLSLSLRSVLTNLFVVWMVLRRLRAGVRRGLRTLRAPLAVRAPSRVPFARPRGLPLGPVVDGAVVPRHPFETIREGFARDVSVLVGTTLEEMKLFGILDPAAHTLTDATLIARCEQVIPGADAHGLSHGRRAVDVYRAARAARGMNTTPAELWYAIESDRTMRYPAMRLAELQSAHQAQTYAYLFTWRSPLWGGVLGACHGLELPFVFGTLGHPVISRFSGSGPAAERLAEQIQDAWIAFVHTGSPGHSRIAEWPPYEPRRRATMILGPQVRQEDAPFEPERVFWESVDTDG